MQRLTDEELRAKTEEVQEASRRNYPEDGDEGPFETVDDICQGICCVPNEVRLEVSI